MSDPLPEPLPEPAAPPPLTVAASLVAVQGIVLVALAVLEVADLDADRRSMGLSTAGFFAAYGVLLLVAAWALWRQKPWSRGPALITQLIFFGLAWNLRDHALVAVVLAVVAAIVLAGVLHPDSIRALTGDHPDD
ncbi:hypothetical protein DJ010_00290 [Nocardioides silvaticus]|uniref:Integral membrane protein n=1 Tax=Nocardioides silvaticus TaxID=2201891 RepID=A0A316TLL0_9ACTN|nr:hypothetical protein [Nocardioides silvaticus]PWN04139.1 hypothetical protein DJ010_00290 [Nocardioides silvaticus]